MSEVIVRGIPWEGRRWRWCAQRPWPAKDVIVKLVDKASDYNAEEAAKRQGCKDPNDAVPEEIDSAILAELRADARIAVQVMGEEPGAELHKAEVARLEKVIEDQRRQLSEYSEAAAKGQDINALAHERGAKLSAAEAEIVRLKAELAAGRKKG